MFSRKLPLVLVLSNNAVQTEKLCSLFELEGYTVVAATAISSATEILQKRKIDLIITNLDLILTEKEQLFNSLKNNSGFAEIPILVLGTENESILEALEAGADDFIEDDADDLQIIARSSKLIERKQAHALLKESEDYFRSLVDNVSDIISILSYDGTILYESASVEHVLGHQQKEIIGKNAFDFVHPDDRERIVKYFYECAAKFGKSSEPIEYRFRDSDDNWRILESVGKVINHPTKGFIAVVNSRDVTERRKSENALRDSEEKFRMVLDNSTDIIYQINLKTRTFDYVSRAAKGVTGYEQEDYVKGGFDFTHSLVVAEDLDIVRNSYNQAIENISKGIREHSIEYRLNTKHKGVRWIRENRAILTDTENQPVAIISTARDVTEQKDFEASLHLQKTLLESQTEASMDGILAIDIEGKIISHNRRFIEMWELSESDVKGKNSRDVIYAIIHKLKCQDVFLEEAKMLAENPDEFKNHLIKLQDGRFFESYSVPIKDAEDKYFGRVWFIRDITERKRTENALRESEDNYRDIVENSQELICTHDLKGNIVSINKKVEEVLGLDRSLIHDINLIDIIIPETRENFSKYLEEIRTKGFAHGLMYVKDKNGDTRVWEYNNTLRTEGVPEPIVRGMAIDISKRKQAEDNLRESEARFRNVADTAPVWIWIAGLDKKLYYANKTFLDFTGNEIEFEIVNGWKQIHPDDLEYARKVYYKAFQDKKEYRLEYRHRRADGEYRWVLLIGVPRFTPNGNFLGFIGSGLDIHERRQAEEALKKTEEKLVQAQKLESVGRLAGGIAHDFNNMLTAIIGYSDLSLRKLQDDAPLRRNIEEVKKAAQRSALLTSQLLAFSRQAVLKPKILSFNELISDTFKMLQRLIGEQIQLNLNLDPKVGLIEADPGQLTQVIVNLAVNARDAMMNGGVLNIQTEKLKYNEDFPVKVEGIPAKKYVLLTVKDTGSGIEKEHLANIFEPFYTTKEIGKGTGLGLATVYGIVKQSNGEITVESEIGEGTVFKLYFPCVEKEKTADEKLASNQSLKKGNETILIIEDEPMVRDLTRQILEAEGYLVLSAENGKVALGVVQEMKGAIDLVITDVVMPEMSGIEFSRAAKAIYPTLPILFTSGYSEDTSFFEDLRDADAMFLSKPYVAATLTGKVREFLDMRTK